MSRPLSFTQASLARAIKGVQAAGLYALGVKSDGTLIIGEKPLDTASLVPVEPQQSPVTSSWDDV